jgi:hypothetical protein
MGRYLLRERDVRLVTEKGEGILVYRIVCHLSTQSHFGFWSNVVDCDQKPSFSAHDGAKVRKRCGAMSSGDGMRGAVSKCQVDIVAAGAVVGLGSYVCVGLETAEQVSVVVWDFIGTAATNLVVPSADVLKSEFT